MNLKKTFIVSHFLLNVGWVVQLIAAIALILTGFLMMTLMLINKGV